ncbi:hypothetical protein QR685DRAFT_276217 [Neurospora intermedia]|uniref:Uncharacterized protein n=1 Tax=Neurospora intermedia TaxID=5142 RepID=A0ABR3DH94_NEUIN
MVIGLWRVYAGSNPGVHISYDNAPSKAFKTAKTGCHLCCMILHVILCRQPDDTQFKFGLFLWCCKVSYTHTIGTFLNGKELDTKSEISQSPTFQIARPSAKIERLPSLDSNFGVTPLEVAKNWLQVCQHNHTRCRPPKSTSTPWAQQLTYIRLISIQYQDNGGQIYRLIKHAPSGRSCCLYHFELPLDNQRQKEHAFAREHGEVYRVHTDKCWPQINRAAAASLSKNVTLVLKRRCVQNSLPPNTMPSAQPNEHSRGANTSFRRRGS